MGSIIVHFLTLSINSINYKSSFTTLNFIYRIKFWHEKCKTFGKKNFRIHAKKYVSLHQLDMHQVDVHQVDIAPSQCAPSRLHQVDTAPS